MQCVYYVHIFERFSSECSVRACVQCCISCFCFHVYMLTLHTVCCQWHIYQYAEESTNLIHGFCGFIGKYATDTCWQLHCILLPCTCSQTCLILLQNHPRWLLHSHHQRSMLVFTHESLTIIDGMRSTHMGFPQFDEPTQPNNHAILCLSPLIFHWFHTSPTDQGQYSSSPKYSIPPQVYLNRPALTDIYTYIYTHTQVYIHAYWYIHIACYHWKYYHT